MRVSALTPPLSGCEPWKDHKPANRLHRDSQEVAVTGCLSFLEMSAVAHGPFTGPLIAAGCVQVSDFLASLDSLTFVVSSPSIPPFILLHLPQAWRRLPHDKFPHSTSPLVLNPQWPPVCKGLKPRLRCLHLTMGAIMTNSCWEARRSRACHSNCAWNKRQNYPLFYIVLVHREDSALTLYNYLAIISKLAYVSKSLT